MNPVYQYLILLNAAASLAAAVAVFWRNRTRAVGPLLGGTMLILGLWGICFAHYFEPLDPKASLWWAYWTLAFSILNLPFFFYSMCAMVDRQWEFRWWILVTYVVTAFLLVMLWQGQLVVGLRPTPYMDHYIRYNRAWYPLLAFHESVWPTLGVAVLVQSALRAAGYKRAQLIYFAVAASTVFLTTSSIILPLEYDFFLPPYGILVLPLNLAFLAYVMAKARLADFNVVIARVLLLTVTLMVVVGISLMFIAGMMMMSPQFMNNYQILFTMTLAMVIGLVLTISLPRLLPRAERLMQERLFGASYGYQAALSGLVKELGRLPNIDQIFAAVATTVHFQMHVSRVLMLFQNPHTGGFQLQAQSGLGPRELETAHDLATDSAIIKWLSQNKDVLVREEMARRVDEATQQLIADEQDRLRVVICVPMFLEDNLVGIICLGPKLNRDMFFISDLKLLETLATEVALAVKYRHMEEAIGRKNRLMELGTIAAGVAHEIRNPLASVRTFAQLLPERIDDPEFKNEFSKIVLKDVDRITRVVETMLAFAHPAQLQVGQYSVAELVEEALLLMQTRFKAKAVLLTKQHHAEAQVKADKQQILQVLINILNNAVDAIPQGGSIQITTGVRSKIDGELGRKRKFATMEISDNGPGIPLAVRNRLFDPFFTTKKEGTGLGLSISQKIVRDHGGVITVSSIEGKGTTFQVDLPLN